VPFKGRNAYFTSILHLVPFKGRNAYFTSILHLVHFKGRNAYFTSVKNLCLLKAEMHILHLFYILCLSRAEMHILHLFYILCLSRAEMHILHLFYILCLSRTQNASRVTLRFAFRPLEGTRCRTDVQISALLPEVGRVELVTCENIRLTTVTTTDNQVEINQGKIQGDRILFLPLFQLALTAYRKINHCNDIYVVGAARYSPRHEGIR
jgi:hypothetical protein